MGPDEMSSLPEDLAQALAAEVRSWEDGLKVVRLWDRDPTLWTDSDEDRWLGWLQSPEHQLGALAELDVVAPSAFDGAFDDVVVLGMGGSSLCPDVLRLSFGQQDGAPHLRVLDTTDPAQIQSLEQQVGLDRTLFIVSSKSGTTLESDLLLRYFLDRVRSQPSVAAAAAGTQFVAVTDPGSQLELLAQEQQFRALFGGTPSIGGRFSALSPFGLVPASAMGLDVRRLLDGAVEMSTCCGPTAPVRENPGALLGLLLAVAARRGCDKVTLVGSPRLSSLGTWIEQLLAESTGKGGQGLVPVDGEALAAPEAYGTDRVFIYIRDSAAPSADQDTAIERLEQAGYPVVRLSVADPYRLGAEFYRWEFATAVAGAALGLNPFDQPDVEASKIESRRLMAAFERNGVLPTETPVAVAGSAANDDEAGLQLFADAVTLHRLGGPGSAPETALERLVAAHCASLAKGDYAAILAYIEMSTDHAAALQELRHVLRDATGTATCVGFGPRFLHSTGQVHKGGPDTGVFFVITAEEADGHDLAVPGRPFSFSTAKAAQAQGDLEVLRARDRRVVRLHILGDVRSGIERLTDIVRQAVVGRS